MERGERCLSDFYVGYDSEFSLVLVIPYICCLAEKRKGAYDEMMLLPKHPTDLSYMGSRESKMKVGGRHVLLLLHC